MMSPGVHLGRTGGGEAEALTDLTATLGSDGRQQVRGGGRLIGQTTPWPFKSATETCNLHYVPTLEEDIKSELQPQRKLHAPHGRRVSLEESALQGCNAPGGCIIGVGVGLTQGSRVQGIVILPAELE